jgi:hypothetical protein
MKLQRFISISLVYLGLAFANAASAFDMGNMMNPSMWMDKNNNNDRYADYYDEPGYGYPPPPVMAMAVPPVTVVLPVMVTVAIQAMAMVVLPHTVHREPNPMKPKSCA